MRNYLHGYRNILFYVTKSLKLYVGLGDHPNKFVYVPEYGSKRLSHLHPTPGPYTEKSFHYHDYDGHVPVVRLLVIVLLFLNL